MELVWHKGYEDYDDPAWQARKDRLTAAWKSVSRLSSKTTGRKGSSYSACTLGCNSPKQPK